jgi:hypothetical protein
MEYLHLEDLNGDGYVRVLATGVWILMIRMGMESNFLDVDDDGDGYGTKKWN